MNALLALLIGLAVAPFTTALTWYFCLLADHRTTPPRCISMWADPVWAQIRRPMDAVGRRIERVAK